MKPVVGRWLLVVGSGRNNPAIASPKTPVIPNRFSGEEPAVFPPEKRTCDSRSIPCLHHRLRGSYQGTASAVLMNLPFDLSFRIALAVRNFFLNYSKRPSLQPRIGPLLAFVGRRHAEPSTIDIPETIERQLARRGPHGVNRRLFMSRSTRRDSDA